MQLKRDPKCTGRETRWDRIKRKHSQSFNVTNERVKQFLQMNFVKPTHIRLMNGNQSPTESLNPSLVMNIRHEMINRHKEKFIHFDPIKDLQMERIREHNEIVEEKYFKHEMMKYNETMVSKRLKSAVKSDSNHFKTKVVVRLSSLDEEELSEEFPFKNNPEIEIDKSDSLSSFDEDYYEPNPNVGAIMVEVIPKPIENRPIQNIQSKPIKIQNSPELDLMCPANIVVPLEPIKIQGSQININEISDSLKIHRIDLETFDSFSDQIDEKSNESPLMSTTKDDIITELFAAKPLGTIQRTILQKYFLKWLHVTTISKLSGDKLCKDGRIQKIECFLDNLRQMKKQCRPVKEPTVNLTKKSTMEPDCPIILLRKYQNKLKIQQDIIELQRLKLERQQRMINELKNKKIGDDMKDSHDSLKDELKNISRNGDFRLRAKAKCLQIAANLKDSDDEEYNRLQAKGLIAPRFLIEMQERAMERNNRHRQARERREQLEREKEDVRQQAEEEKRLQDEESKRRRIDELREKRRQEKFKKIRRENERRRYLENVKRATEFYRLKLLMKFGINAFKLLLKLKRTNEHLAIRFYKRKLQGNYFKPWLAYVRFVWEERRIAAIHFYNQSIQLKFLRVWEQYLLDEKRKMDKAIKWSGRKLCQRIIKIWIRYTEKEKLITELKQNHADLHYNWHLKWRVFEHWQRLQQILKIEKETEERRLKWRMKIWDLIPDYTPNLDDL